MKPSFAPPHRLRTGRGFDNPGDGKALYDPPLAHGFGLLQTLLCKSTVWRKWLNTNSWASILCLSSSRHSLLFLLSSLHCISSSLCPMDRNDKLQQQLCLSKCSRQRCNDWSVLFLSLVWYCNCVFPVSLSSYSSLGFFSDSFSLWVLTLMLIWICDWVGNGIFFSLPL